MISITFFLHPTRKDNFDRLHEAYSKYQFVNEVLVVTGKNVSFPNAHEKFKFVHFDGPYEYGAWPHLGLLARYIFAVSCRNRFVFIQDDDMLYTEESIKKLYNMQGPIAGFAQRWYINGIYQSEPPETQSDATTAPMILTSGVMIDAYYMPDVIKLAKEFFGGNYQKIFNGEDIFMSRAMAYITGQNEFPFIKDGSTKLFNHNVQLYKKFHNHKTRAQFCQLVYDFFQRKSL